MENINKKTMLSSKEYYNWIKELKEKFQQSQIKASVQVNSTLLECYWELGKDIVEKQKNSPWGSGFLNQLSKDLIKVFPNIKGFSKRNLELVRKWYLFYNQSTPIAKQVVSQLYSIPWGHNINIVTKCVVVELKTVDFEPEFAGKLNFYIKTVNEQIKTKEDKLIHEIPEELGLI